MLPSASDTTYHFQVTVSVINTRKLYCKKPIFPYILKATRLPPQSLLKGHTVNNQAAFSKIIGILTAQS